MTLPKNPGRRGLLAAVRLVLATMLCLAAVPVGAGVNMSAGESGDPGDGTGFMSAGGSTFATDQPPWAVRSVQPRPDAVLPPRFLLVPVPAGNGTVVFIVIDLSFVRGGA